MNPAQRAQLTWLKSSYSGDEGGECVEVALGDSAVHVRDSKGASGNGRSQLVFTRSAWAGFLADLERGQV